MKKTILIIYAVALMANNGKAQKVSTDVRERLLFGVKIGANSSNVYDARGEEFHADPKLGLAVGAFLLIPINKTFGIQPEVLFSQKGFQATGRLFGETYNVTRTTNYIDVPLLFAFKPNEFLTLLAGPQYSYLMMQRNSFKNATTGIIQEKEFDNDNVHKNTLCLLTGIDINIKHFVLGARAGWDLQNNQENGTSTTPRYKNVWYQATIGYRYYKH